MSTLTGKTTATIRCGLCKEVILLESDFRATPVDCPHCGLKFVFDPQKQPLPVRGMRLRWSEVEALRRGGTARRRRHDAHTLTTEKGDSPDSRAGTTCEAPSGPFWQMGIVPLFRAAAKVAPLYLAWAGTTLAIAAAGFLTLFRWLHR